MDEALREPMDMPEPRFPVKVHRCRHEGKGKVLFPHHWHEHLEFLYFVTGEASLELGSATLRAKEGDLIVVNSNELHAGISHSDHLFYYALIADISLLQSHTLDAAEMKFITPIAQNRLLFGNRITNDETRLSMLTIIQELENRSFGYELAIKSELYRLLALLLRGFVATVLTPDEYDQRMKNVQRFAPIFEYIDKQYQEPITVDQLAGMAGLSRFHFSRLFKELSGKTVTEFVNETRISKADQLLRSSPLTVSEIAVATGFNDIYYFSRLFKKHKKIAPSAVRKH
ncbi:helix-turn-helix domain-containing protein [Paenibacillus protaetiae]|uniref:AraC family transcriptional regulator n=1 Tax=Paenibacillus protaetiae TaxID=2509456 RepID=A0A4P6EUX8_9BACL|nr:AraC family transcriptional regulator [Paenibacillus protaetiae]QAY66486.1 AraC family transcriptional regulator [Paenibacillus protaetiae]